jgi:hypothetical protein
MRPDTRAWLEGLRDFVTEQRRTKPLAQLIDPAHRAAERSMLASHFVSWLDDLTELLAARQATVPGADPDPAIVLTTSAVGIEAATDLWTGGHPLAMALEPAVAAVTELEYRLWCMRSPDEEHRLHVNHWNWIKTRVPPQRAGEFARHPLGPGECYWLHRTGTAGAGRGDRRDCHLWKWNGRHASLLEARIREAAVSHLDRSGASGSGGD